jgi:hypothetical protein
LTRDVHGRDGTAEAGHFSSAIRPLEAAMSNPTYMGSATPVDTHTDYSNYYPTWLDKLADDVTIEGSLMEGAAQGPEAVRAIIGAIRSFYEHQQLNFAGRYGDSGFLEDYTVHVRGEPLGSAVLVTSNAAGQTQHVAANYRPRGSLLLFSRLIGEKLTGTPYAEYFLTSESEGGSPG